MSWKIKKLKTGTHNLQTSKEERFLNARKSWNPKEMGSKKKNSRKFTKVIDSEADP